jgi:hypothetical protein
MIPVINELNEVAMMFRSIDGSVVMKDLSSPLIASAVDCICNLALELSGSDSLEEGIPLELWIASPKQEYEYFTTIYVSGVEGLEVVVDSRALSGYTKGY